ncbi:NACHT domain-containing protein (plasmid) [Tistrella mobilis]|uniref:NACHT domain-containing protein n=1 Tax=Tistrella mobilis TaxID=171437 RepID=UPI0035584B5C
MKISEADLRVFADLGTDFHEVHKDSENVHYHFLMSAQNTVVSLHENSDVVRLSIAGEEITYPNIRALLASKYFGHLNLWASNQSAILRDVVPAHPIPIMGEMDELKGNVSRMGIEEFDTYLLTDRNAQLDVIILDGPAGIGKTTQIHQISLKRARNFRTQQNRLLLHVESTGRVLQNLDDLIAGSLQKIRAKPTFDQLRVLVRHGLVTLAIDGFDELADPNGYELAWGQLRDLLKDVEGAGQVILAGRETFVSIGRMKNALPILDNININLCQYRLHEVEPRHARNWLLEQGLEYPAFDKEEMNGIFSSGSYALRPFFLSSMVKGNVIEDLQSDPSADILSFLVNALIDREKDKFGEDIRRSISSDELVKYIQALCEEIARDMADNQSESLPGQTLEWAAGVCIPEGADTEVARVLIHRAQNLPFLSPDRDRNTVKFAHRQFLVFFLGLNAIKCIAGDEFPKYLRRNILGSEFLETFPKAILSLPGSVVRNFRDNALGKLPQMNALDRSAGNISSLVLICGCYYPPNEKISIKYISMDEIYLFGTVPPVDFENVSISILNAYKADLGAVNFSGENSIVTLRMDPLTRLPPKFLLPSWLEFEGKTFKSKPEIQSFLFGTENSEESDKVDFPFDRDLLDRILRYRPFWLREDLETVEPVGRNIIEHRDWSKARQWLSDKGLLRIEERYPASGRSSAFIHFRIGKDDLKR